MLIDIEEVITATRRWLEKSVIGLNLCPFAAGPYRENRVYFRVSEQRNASGLLLIHPWVLDDFIEYNEFLEECDTAIADLGLEGELQVASFHPRYQFADTQSDDIENFTNRSPYPTLHLLREESVERAVEASGDAAEIYRRNIRTLRNLGHAGWRRLWEG
jgi:uncharacterized protein